MQTLDPTSLIRPESRVPVVAASDVVVEVPLSVYPIALGDYAARTYFVQGDPAG